MSRRPRILRLIGTPFGLTAVICLVVAGWALWYTDLADGPVARTVRTSSIYAAPGIALDTAAAQQIIGNRRLVVIMLESGADLQAGCESVKRATEGALVLLLSPEGDEYNRYGCSQIEGDFGNKFVAETMIDDGVDEFVDRPLDALKVIVLNYDQLVKSEIVPAGARTIRPSGPRYIAAAEAAGTILSGVGVLYAAARRAARIAERVRARRDQATDSRTRLSASSAAVAGLLVDIDRSQPGVASGVEYRRLAWEYAGLLDDVATADRAGEFDYSRFTAWADELATRLRALA